MTHTPVIAIVDDDESFRQATISFIRSLGYSTAAFPSADAFLNSNAVENPMESKRRLRSTGTKSSR